MGKPNEVNCNQLWCTVEFVNVFLVEVLKFIYHINQPFAGNVSEWITASECVDLNELLQTMRKTMTTTMMELMMMMMIDHFL